MNTVTFPNVPNNVTFCKTFVYQNSDGSARDLTGSRLTMTVRASAADATVFLSLDSVSGGIMIIDAVNGRFTITAAQSVMKTIAPATYVHDLVRTRPDGTTEQVWAGILVIVQGVTR